ncbi:hypothetical protein QAD02_016479 [Eretmocerus hayati]|uniref:Uncharacterized protein n=1 Tax=Eretmocerus hayati TaxID=131215 RepID=A0ACC2PBK5_9HYME|nr:hypothetical protein QAD02_016479 [Eretmocerus hayati]
MNNLLEDLYAWTGSFVEAFIALIYDIVDVVIKSLNYNGTDSSSGQPAASTEKSLPNLPQVLQDAASFLAFDDFQYLLLKIFIAILLGNFCLIYVAWYVYGERITDRFMSPSSSSEELKRNISLLKLPTEHSQRHS